MKALAIDTTSSMSTVVLFDEVTCLYAQTLNIGKTHTRCIDKQIRDALAWVNWRAADLTGFGCVVGPGSFTGIRIGIAMIQGLSLVAQQPIAPLGRLALLASPQLSVSPEAFVGSLHAVRQATALTEIAVSEADLVQGLVIAIDDARGGRCYVQVFNADGALMPALASTYADVRQWLDAQRKGLAIPIQIIGSGAPLLADACQTMGQVTVLETLGLSPLALMKISSAYLSSYPQNCVRARQIEANYLSVSQAERLADLRVSYEFQARAHD